MWEVVFAFGLFVVLACLYLLVRTEQVLDLVDDVFGTRWIYLAATFRLLLGAALIASADAVRYPQLVQAVGWIAAFGGIVLVAVPQAALLRLVHWFIADRSLVLMRVWLVAALLFGVFMTYVALV